MILERLEVGPLAVNCYILGCMQNKEAIVIDPGAKAEKIKDCLNKRKLKIKFIVNTHGHLDHIGANTLLAAPVYIHRLDAALLQEPQLELASILGEDFLSSKPAGFLEEGQELTVGNISLVVIHTPGHTPGGICLKAEGFVFTGDTLFAQGIGRTDIPGACEKDLFNSIRKKLFTLDDDLVIYPGHGPSSTVGEEKPNNPFL